MKKLIAQIDAIETGKKFIAESVTPVVEYKGGTDAEKIKNWQDHIKNFDAFPKAQDDARQAAKKAQPGAKFYKTDDKPKKEGMGSIARALMQDMGVEERITSPNPNSSQSQQLSGADPARAQYDKFKADDARTAAVKQIKDMLKPNGQGVERLQTAIDPATGIIYWGEEQGEGGMVNPRQTPFDWVKQGQYKDLEAILKAAGLNIIPINQKGLFGTTQIAAVDPKGLATLDQQPTPAPQPAPTSSTDTGTAGQRPGQYFPRDAVDASIDQADADAGAAAQAALDQQALSNMDMQVGQGAQRAPAQPDVGTPELNIGQGSQNAPVQGGEEELGTIDPNDVKRFGELLDKLEKGASGAAANPPAGQQASKPAAQGYKGSAGAQAIHKLNPQIKDINKIFPGQQLKMPDGSTYTVKPGDTMDKITRGMRSGAGANPPSATTSPQVMQGTMPAADPRAGRGYGTVREDDAILARIKAVKL